MEEVFQKLGSRLKADLEDVKWVKSSLEIMRLQSTVRFSANYQDQEDNTKDVEVNFGFWEARSVHKLYEITQNHPLEHKNWNRAIFTLYPDNKFDMEYIWDQELQDRVDGYNNDNQS